MASANSRVDKNYCMSSYLAFRFIERDDKDFYGNMRHQNLQLRPDSEKTFVRTADDIDGSIQAQLTKLSGKKIGVLLSGGMDSAIVASYVPGGNAYTFRFLGGDFQREELSRAEYYASCYNLKLHYVDISWETVERYLDSVIAAKSAPVHSIEPQIMQAADQAKSDGVEVMLIGDGSDYVFGGFDKLLSKDWDFDSFVRRYCSLTPSQVLVNPVDMSYAFEPYRLPNGKIDFLGFMDNVCTRESYSSYHNAFSAASLPYFDPYANLKMAEALDLSRIRSGEPKYLIRELMAKRYPKISVPDKQPMPRPVDIYFSSWEGPKRREFKSGLNMSEFTGNQKWLLWCLEYFLNKYEKKEC